MGNYQVRFWRAVEGVTPSLTLIIRDEGLRLGVAVGASETLNAYRDGVRPGVIQATVDEVGITRL